MTKLKFINLFLLQWFFVRLVRCSAGSYSWFSIVYFVMPLTGWNSPFVYLNRGVYLRLTGRKSISK